MRSKFPLSRELTFSTLHQNGIHTQWSFYYVYSSGIRFGLPFAFRIAQFLIWIWQCSGRTLLKSGSLFLLFHCYSSLQLIGSTSRIWIFPFHHIPKMIYAMRFGDFGGHFNTENSVLCSVNQFTTIFWCIVLLELRNFNYR